MNDEITEKREAIRIMHQLVEPTPEQPHKKDRHPGRWFFFFPVVVYLFAVIVWTRTLFLFNTADQLSDIFLWSGVALGVTMVGNLLLALLFLLVG